ncbi:linoleoyl-CoA desaturase [Paraburkholderia phenazinium]|uniref:Linoleoyl-CoA desaturase n=1 Tax=Paraburkholderia phenazinium TaxID=60549 RepID=A0A1G8MFP4_9BURK|nr:acyl-CoA desaturase [Paraburkholderia phenazinium]SDI66761.1 linoleoyl-CoA desaturase [Paraburkholderia phenazinium]
MRPHYLPSSTSPFSAELRREVAAYLASRLDHRFGNALTWLKAGCLLAIACALFATCLCAHSAAGFLAAYVGMFLAAVMLSVNSMHDASHGALSRFKWLNTLVRRAVTLPLGIEPAYWQARHVFYHHAYPNLEHYDLDTEANLFLRQTPFQAWHPHFRFQHLYWPVIAALSLPYINWIYDWSDRLGKTPLAQDRLLPGVRGWVVFVASKLLHFGVFLLLPLLLRGHEVGYGRVFAAYMAGQTLASCILLMLILGTHWAETQFYLLPDTGHLPHTRDEHAFLTCCDWITRPAFIGAWLGGLNHHLTHHLFPGYSHRHYGAIAQIVERLARQHGLPYRAIGYAELLASQQRFLRQMGQPPGNHPMSST